MKSPLHGVGTCSCGVKLKLNFTAEARDMVHFTMCPVCHKEIELKYGAESPIKLADVLGMFKFKEKSSKSELTVFTDEELITRFSVAKLVAGAADAERDRLRSHIQEMPAGRHGKYILTHDEGAKQCYPNAEGKHALMNFTIVVPATGEIIDNKTLYTYKGSHLVKIVEVPID